MYQDGGVMTWFAVPDRFFMVHGMRGRCVKVPSRFSFCKLRRYSDGEISPESCWQKGFQGKQKTGLQYEDSQQTIICLLSGQCIPYTHMDPTWTRRLFDLKPTQQAKLLPISNAANEPSLVWFSLPSASVKAEAPEAAGASGRALANPWNWAESSPRKQMDGWKMVRRLSGIGLKGLLFRNCCR